MKWTDENIDKLFKRAADEHQLSYNTEYWKDFEGKHLNQPFIGTVWSDEAIDSLFRDQAARQQIEFKPVYWDNFELLLPKVQPVASAWSDNEIDNLFKDTARFDQVAYKQEYWNEFESMLPQRKKRDYLWFVFSYSFIGLIGLMMFTNGQVDQVENRLADINSNDEEFVQLEENMTLKSNLAEVNPQEKDIEEQDLINDEPYENLISESNETPVITETPVQDDNLIVDQISDVNESSDIETGTIEDNTASVVETNDQVIDQQIKEPIVSLDEEVLLSVIPENEQSDLLGVNQLPINELERTEAELQTLNPMKIAPRTRILPYFQVLGGLSQSLITPSEHLSSSYGVGAGISFNRDRLGLNLSFNGLVSNHQDLELSRTAKVYGFGSTVYNYDLNYQRLYLLEGNLEFEYNFKKSSLRLGVRPSYLLSTKVEFNKKDVYNDINLLESAERKTFYGYKEGISKFGIKPTIGFAYDIFPAMELGVNLGVQLRPMVNEDYINGVNNTLPIDGQIYLRKYIIRKY